LLRHLGSFQGILSLFQAFSVILGFRSSSFSLQNKLWVLVEVRHGKPV